MHAAKSRALSTRSRTAARISMGNPAHVVMPVGDSNDDDDDNDDDHRPATATAQPDARGRAANGRFGRLFLFFPLSSLPSRSNVGAEAARAPAEKNTLLPR
ncbi:hypothetical protein [Pandoravirus japonicus]|uniref:Uncharacterized protein n=1 Tax=Pandoravirus japonicus TaxID=2823154 RepID=A0A811BQT6_9VIRU|nr:hypothetical protein [Pandoravirus japonicus]